MQFSTYLLFFCAASALTQASPLEKFPKPTKDPLAGYAIEEISWELEVTPGGEKLFVNGTVENAVEAVKLKNANWEADFGIETVQDYHKNVNKRSIEKRAEWVQIGCSLWREWEWANYHDAHDAVRYLRGIKGNPTNKPKTCGRVSCAYGTAVYWCNENTYQKTLNSWGEIADGTLEIIKRCTNLFINEFNGQIWERYLWNTIVKGNERC